MKLKIICLALAFNFFSPADLMAAGAPKAAKNIASSDVECVMTADFGTAENQLGSPSKGKKVMGFYAPTSFDVKNGDIYILDAPNYRIIKYGSDKKAHKVCILEKTDGRKKILYSDIALLADNSMLVTSGHGVLYEFDKTGKFIKKIKAAEGVKMVNKFGVDETGNIILPDPLNGKTVIAGADGKKIADVPFLAESAFFPQAGIVNIAKKKEKNESVISLNISYPVDKKKGGRTIEVKIDEPVRGASLVGVNADNSFVLFISTAKGTDFLDATYAVKISPEGKVIKKINIPLKSHLTTIRNIRLENAGSLLFATEGEEGYIISRYKF